MNETTTQLLFALLRSAICNKPMSPREKALYDPSQLPTLWRISQNHDVAHILGHALEINMLSGAPEVIKEFQNNQFAAVFRYEQLNYAEKELFAALEAANIPFLPLKGSIIRKFYPHPWMRTSCDVDVLVPEAQLEAAVEYLLQHCGYTRVAKGSHDVNLLTPDRRHIELHYTLIEDEHAGASVLREVWNGVIPKEGYRYWHTMPDALFYYYHIAHMAKHFELGGCGIRSLIDLWLLDKQTCDKDARDELLKRGGLLQFAEAARKLSRVWLDDAEPDKLCLQMQDFIFHGGVFGTRKNLVKIAQVKSDGKASYVLSRIFLRYDVLKYQYPVLEKHRWLMPVCQVRRWCKLVSGPGLKNAARELSYQQENTAEQVDETKTLLTQLGLL